MPTIGAHSSRSATSACVVGGNSPSAMQRSTRASARLRISEMKAKRSYSRLTRGTRGSRNTSAKYCGCSLLNS